MLASEIRDAIEERILNLKALDARRSLHGARPLGDSSVVIGMTNDALQAQEEARQVARGLIGRTIYTLGRNKPILVEDVSEAGVEVHAKTADTVFWKWIDAVIDELAARGELAQKDLKPDNVPGFQRSDFIFAFLTETSFAEQVVDASTISLKWTRKG